MHLQVNVPRLNKRRLVPLSLPDHANIAGEVLAGFTFEGTEVNTTEIPNPAFGKWYKDRDGYFYWGGGVMEIFGLTEIETTTPVRAASLRTTEEIPLPEIPTADVSEVFEEIPWWITSLGIPEIWKNFNERGANAKVAVIDSGYNINNAEIKDAVVAQFIHPAFPSTVSINDTFGHGSYCASLIGSRNRNFIIGCAPECKLFIAKMSEDDSYENNILFDAIAWAINQNVDIISISQGGPFDNNTCNLIKSAIDKNIMVIASIGNNRNMQQPIQGGKHPALCSDCFAVGATDKINNLSIVTLRNNKTEINAPGESISGYGLRMIPEIFNDGTSQATAIVAGICALIVSRLKNLNRTYSVAEVKELVTENFDVVANSSTQKLISPLKIFSKI